MKSVIATALLAATAAVAAPGTGRHQLFHRQKRAPMPAVPAAALNSREVYGVSTHACDTDALARLNTLGIEQVNLGTKGVIYPGSKGPYVQNVQNTDSSDLVVVAWANGQFGFNASSLPLFTMYVPGNSNATFSMTSSFNGAMSTVHACTQTNIAGQIFNTWVEQTAGEYGVVDVSREANMDGVNIAVAGSDCTTDMTQCVFTCLDNAPTCYEANTYNLTNCATSLQKGASVGTYNGQPSGGCMLENEVTWTVSGST